MASKTAKMFTCAVNTKYVYKCIITYMFRQLALQYRYQVGYKGGAVINGFIDYFAR